MCCDDEENPKPISEDAYTINDKAVWVTESTINSWNPWKGDARITDRWSRGNAGDSTIIDFGMGLITTDKDLKKLKSKWAEGTYPYNKCTGKNKEGKVNNPSYSTDEPPEKPSTDD